MAALTDAATPAALQRLIDDKCEGATHGDKGLHQQGQQLTTAFKSGPAGAIDGMMVEAELWGLAQAHLPECRRYGAPSARQQGAHQEYLDFAPSGRGKEALNRS
jgi:hypothetical protein